MKMGTGLFWGILLVLLGISLIFKVVFNVSFPVFKIFFAFFFIFIGIKILIGDSFKFNWKSDRNNTIFAEQFVNDFSGMNNEYNVVFGKGVFDLSSYNLDSTRSNYIEFNAVFAGAEIWVPRELPVKIKVDAVFAGASLPNGNSAVFGSNQFVSDNFDPAKPHLFIKSDVVFGGLDIRYK